MIDIFEAMAELKKNTSRTVLHAYDYDTDFYLLEAVKDSKTIDYGGSYYAVNKNDGSIYHYSCNADFDKFFDAINNRKIDISNTSELKHHGILGMKWGIRRYQNKDGSLTPAGKKRYSQMAGKLGKLNTQINVNRYKARKAYERGDYASGYEYEWNRQFPAEVEFDKLYDEFVDTFGEELAEKLDEDPKFKKYAKKGLDYFDKMMVDIKQEQDKSISEKRKIAETDGRFDLDFLEIAEANGSLDKKTLLIEYDKYLEDPEKWSTTYDTRKYERRGGN